MIRGRVPKPSALRRADGNPGKRGYNAAEPIPPGGVPDCPAHLGVEARAEWDRLAVMLHGMGVLTLADRGCLAAYCQAWGRWVEAEERLAATPMLLKTPSGYVQQSPWLSIANRQMELMGRYMTELGLTPAARSRVAAYAAPVVEEPVTRIELVMVESDGQGRRRYSQPLDGSEPPRLLGPDEGPGPGVIRIQPADRDL